MKALKRWAGFILTVAMCFSLSGCTIPMPGFADYDVSGYIQALLDSSYHDSNEDLMAVAKITEEKARQNNKTTVENAAVNFCNAYGLSPSDSQLQELEKVMKQAYALSKYTVKDEQKVETGYYLEVEITSIVNFSTCGDQLKKLKEQAQQEATPSGSVGVVPGAEGSEEGEDGWEEDSEEGEEEASQDPESSSQASTPAPTVDVNTLYVDKVLSFCKQQLANITYDQEPRTIALDIRQTEKGELQLDTNQLDTIDRTVLQIGKR